MKNVVLEGVTGSRAYGLDTPESDEDRKGVYVASMAEMLGLHPPKETIVRHEPDVEYHELAKFVRLALACNPTVLELLWLESYTVLEPVAQRFVEIRSAFLSNRVRKTYGGYAMQQVTRLMNRGDGSFDSDLRKRTAKHARHCFRLIGQGEELLRTGHLTVRVSNREELFAMGELAVKDPQALYEKFTERMALFDATESVLPDEPDMDTVEAALLRARLG